MSSTPGIVTVDDQDTTRIAYRGDWHLSGSSSGAHKGTVHLINTTAGTATFNFNGTSVRVYGTFPASTPPSSQYTLDGRSPVLFTSPNVSSPAFQQRLYTSPPLDDGAHTLTIQSTRNGSSFYIDFIQYSPSGASTSATGLESPTPTATGSSLMPNTPAQTSAIHVTNNDRGVGTGGSVNIMVRDDSGDDDSGDDDSCHDSSSHCSTIRISGSSALARPSGGGGGGGRGGGGGNATVGGTNSGGIAGGVVGGLAAVGIAGLLAFFFLRRRRSRRRASRSVDLLHEYAQREADRPPEIYRHELVGAPSHSYAGADENVGTDQSESAYLGAGAGAASKDMNPKRLGDAPPTQMRAVNVTQHEDAGELPEEDGFPYPAEHIELPPSYTSVRPPREI